jgi:uncharacterized protein (TIGR03437 family)
VTMITQGGQVFPTVLGGVSVSIDTIPCPIYYVSPTQLSVIVPYEVASNQTGLANIQVTNGAASNVVQMYLTDAAPGVFSQETAAQLVTQSGQPSVDGIGYAAALHAATGALVTPDNPAQANEYLSIYLTGLGPVNPPVTDGVLGPSSPLSWADVYGASSLAVFFDDFDIGSGSAGVIQFAGLAVGLAGLYQLNIQVPADVLGPGDDVYLEIVTDAADVGEIEIPFGDSTGTSVKAKAPRAKTSRAAAMRARRRKRSTRSAAVKGW